MADKDPSKMTPNELRQYAHILELEAKHREISASFEGQMAELIHDHTCGHNHTDGCSHIYECASKTTHWDGDSHRRFRQMARELMTAGGFASYLLKEPTDGQ